MDWLQVAATLFTAFTAGFAAYVTWCQYRLGERQHRLALYQDRIRVYRAAVALMHDIIAKGRPSSERITTYLAEVAEADFLFPDEVCRFLTDLTSDAFELEYLHYQLCPTDGLPPGDQRSKTLREKHDKNSEIRQKFNRLKDVFRDHLFIG